MSGKLFDTGKPKIPSNLLVDRFIVPPFTVFNTTRDYWMNRKADWLKLGIVGEAGRTKGTWTRSQSDKDLMGDEGAKKYGRKAQQVSIFDPVICEISYKWFSNEWDDIFDPFAGGPVRGVVATSLNRHYVGVDLRQEQVDANYKNFAEIESKYVINERPKWIQGNSETFDVVDKCDMIFSCPPYFNLEVYSDSEDDLSNKSSYQEFLKSYNTIIKNCCDHLKDNCFAVFVVGNVRDDKTGEYYDLVGDTIRAFQNNGLMFYNEAIMVLSAGSAPIRAPQHFNISRKLERQHANYLVFYKGDPKIIRDKFGVFDERG